MKRYDVIVVGTGGVGSATLFQLAQKGLDVLGLDQFPQVHQHGSSHGESRIIRQAYFEHSDYVPLLLRAYEGWRHVEGLSQQTLFHQIGLIEAGPASGLIIPGVLRSVAQHQLQIEHWTPQQLRDECFLDIPHELTVLYEPTAGYLRVEPCVQTMLQLAQQSGATWQQASVLDWHATAKDVVVVTPTERFAAGRVIFATGAWSKSLLRQCGVPLRIVGKHQYWFPPASLQVGFSPHPFFFELESGFYYGFPPISTRGTKVARHDGGQAWDVPLPLADARDAEDEQLVRNFVRRHVNFAADTPSSTQACMYTISPDEHFVLDRHPNHENVTFAAGLSGHGFKFCTVLGEILSDLCLDGKTSLPAQFLSLARFRP